MPTIAYLGPEHTNTHLAALKRFGRRSRYVHAPTVDDVFYLVERQQADAGVVPVENSLEGAVTHTLDRFIDFKLSPVQIHGEMEMRIRHSLIVHRRASLRTVRVVYSHPQALAQCRRWLDAYLPHAARQETNSTAEAVEKLLQQHGATLMSRLPSRGSAGHAPLFFTDYVRPSRRAAIARAELGRARRLQVVPIPQQFENKTRFLILGLGEAPRGRRNKTAMLFALKDRPGALYDALTPFKRERINLTKIESRPSKQKAWEYYFFIDLEGHVSEPRLKHALERLTRRAVFVKILGSYPVGR
jgi:chorismate mutase/prephenate dehydratase